MISGWLTIKMPPKKARISTSDVPAWQRSIAGFQTVCTVASTSTSTCSSSHADGGADGDSDGDADLFSL